MKPGPEPALNPNCRAQRHPELHAIRASLPLALLRAREALLGPIREMLAASGLTEQQWRVLRVLQEFGELEGNKLAARACLLPPSLSRIIAGMEKRDLVARSAHHRVERRRPGVAAPRPVAGARGAAGPDAKGNGAKCWPPRA